MHQGPGGFAAARGAPASSATYSNSFGAAGNQHPTKRPRVDDRYANYPAEGGAPPAGSCAQVSYAQGSGAPAWNSGWHAGAPAPGNYVLGQHPAAGWEYGGYAPVQQQQPSYTQGTAPPRQQAYGALGYQSAPDYRGQAPANPHSYQARIAYGSGPPSGPPRYDSEPREHQRDHRDHRDQRDQRDQRGRYDNERKRGAEDRRGYPERRKEEVPQAHKVFIGGLPQNTTEGELVKHFEKTAGPVADVVILKDHVTGKNRGFAFVMFKDHTVIDKVISEDGRTRLHELRPGKYVEVKRATEKDGDERGAMDAHIRSSTKPRLQNSCMDCGKRNPKFCMPNENKKRWCGDCAQKNHPEATKTRTMKEKKQREDRCEIFQWARSLDPPRCAYWIVAECPNMKAGKQCDRVHECKKCGFVDEDYTEHGCPNTASCPNGWWRAKSGEGRGESHG